MVLLDLGVVGFIVIDYFCQFLQYFDFRKFYGGYQIFNSLIYLSSDFISICGFDSSFCFFEFYGRDNFLRFWQLLFEFIFFVL